MGEARGVLREKFLSAEVGITGANFLVAETGSAIVVTNEGNADLTMSLPKVHIVLASIDKVVPTLNDAWPLLRLLARSATGQEFTAYTTLVTGPRRAGDIDGPEACHVVIVDNGRSELLRSKLRPVLRCIRCGACMNHCPVYCAIGGHAYGSVYPGPIGAVLTPALAGLPEARTPRAGLDVLRPMRGGVPGRDPARVADAALARDGDRRTAARGEAARCCAPGRGSPSIRVPIARCEDGSQARSACWGAHAGD